jgi:acyl CoA:acetate/3-ketoacid CoA transferase alpha subunit/acyl CoA:acetate/3-ketoacid CoA transferase beta subunit
LGALFFRGGLVDKVITAYSGDSFPTYTPNPIFQEAYKSGEVEVEHWSILTYLQRLEAAARGLPAVVTGSLQGSSMEANDDFSVVDSPFGAVGLLAPLVPDVALLHGVAADPDGNVAVNPPLLEGVWGALAARRGAVVTVEKVVDDLSPWSDLVRIPAHRVLAVAETPMGAHPGGLFARGTPVEGYGEDVDFWVTARDACRGDFDAFARHWYLEPADQDDYLKRLGPDRIDWLRGRVDPESWREDANRWPVDEESPITGWETAAAWGARELQARITAVGADAVLAGAGVANLAAWVGVANARTAGAQVVLTAELGMWGYTPTPADPYIFNHRSFPGASMLTDASHVLGLWIGGTGTKAIGCLGAAQVDRHGNLNSTSLLPAGGPFLVGSGGANDVASRATECLVITRSGPARLPEQAAYVTSPGDRVQTVVTDLGILRKRDGDLCLSAVGAGESPLEDRVRAAAAGCGWDVTVDRDVQELPPPTMPEVLALRRYDPRGWFLR